MLEHRSLFRLQIGAYSLEETKFVFNNLHAFVTFSCKTGHLSYIVPGCVAVAAFIKSGEKW